MLSCLTLIVLASHFPSGGGHPDQNAHLGSGLDRRDEGTPGGGPFRSTTALRSKFVCWGCLHRALRRMAGLVSRHEIRGIFRWGKSVAKRHKADARARMTSPSNLPSQDPAPTHGPTRPPRPRCRVRSSALRLRPSAEAPHGRQATTLRRGFVPVGAIAVRGCGSRAGPSCEARAPGKAGRLVVRRLNAVSCAL